MDAPSIAAPVSVPSPASGRSIASLVLGILGLITCQLLSPMAWYFGWRELRDIASGFAPSSGKDYATIGMVLGIVGTAMLAFVVVVLMLLAVFVIGIVGAAGAFHH